MNTEKLYPELYQVKIKQTITPIRFKDEAINKVKKQNIEFGKRAYIFIPFIVSKDSHQKGLKLKVYKGALGDKETKKHFSQISMPFQNERQYLYFLSLKIDASLLSIDSASSLRSTV